MGAGGQAGPISTAGAAPAGAGAGAPGDLEGGGDTSAPGGGSSTEAPQLLMRAPVRRRAAPAALRLRAPARAARAPAARAARPRRPHRPSRGSIRTWSRSISAPNPMRSATATCGRLTRCPGRASRWWFTSVRPGTTSRASWSTRPTLFNRGAAKATASQAEARATSSTSVLRETRTTSTSSAPKERTTHLRLIAVNRKLDNRDASARSGAKSSEARTKVQGAKSERRVRRTAFDFRIPLIAGRRR